MRHDSLRVAVASPPASVAAAGGDRGGRRAPEQRANLAEAPIAPEQKRPDVRLDVRHPVASDGAEPSVSARPGAVPVGAVAAAVRVRVVTNCSPSTPIPSTLAVVRAVAEVSAGNRAHA